MQRRIHVAFVSIIAFTAYQAYLVLIQRLGFHYVHIISQSLEVKPGVFRALIPILSQTAESITGITSVFWMGMFVVLSAVGVFYSIRYLHSTFSFEAYPDTVAFSATMVIFVITLAEMHVYDFASGMFTALCMALIARRHFIWFYILFPIATLNRETTFLLTIFFFIYGYFYIPRLHWILGSAYQTIMYFLVRVLTLSMFADVPGSLYWSTWDHIITTYRTLYLQTFILITLIIAMLFMVFRGWKQKPEFLRIAFLVIFPLQVILHFTVGMPFEIRVFVESVPLAACLIAYRSTR